MAAGIWPDRTPGTQHGPCDTPCKHSDCANLRDPAFAYPPCKECGEPVKGGDRYYLEGAGKEQGVVHAEHSEERIDAEQDRTA